MLHLVICKAELSVLPELHCLGICYICHILMV